MMNKFSLSLKSVVVSFVAFVSLIGCVGGPEDGNEAAAASNMAGASGSSAGTGGTGGTAGKGGSGGSGGNVDKCAKLDCSDVGGLCAVDKDGDAYCVNPCEDTKCPSGQTCHIVNKLAKCEGGAAGSGGSAGSGGTGGSSGSSGTAGSSGSAPNACNTHNCAANQHCELNEQNAAVCLDDAVQQIDVVMANGCRAVLFDNLGSEVVNSSNGLDVHKAVNAGWAGWAMLTQQCSGQPYKSDWSPIGATASSTNAFTSIKVNGQEVKTHALICADKYGDPGGSKGWKKIAIPMSGGQNDKCP